MENNNLNYVLINDETVKIITGHTLDNSNVHDMVDMITTLQEKKYKYILVDMSLLTFISSAGVGSILGTVETTRENGGDIIIYGASENIKNVFQVLDLLDYLTIRDHYETVKEQFQIVG